MNSNITPTARGGMIGTIDTRNFPDHIFRRQTSIEKTVSRHYKTKISKEPKKLSDDTNTVSPKSSSDTFIEFYASSAPTSSQICMVYHEKDLDVEPFVKKCYESFQYFAGKHDKAYLYDQSERISVTQLGKAIQRVVYNILPTHIISVANYFGLLDNRTTMLSWDDFKQFLKEILRTQPGADEIDEALPINVNNQSEESKQFHDDVRKLMSSKSSKSSNDDDRNSGLLLEPKANGNMVYLSSLSGGPGLNASKNFAKDEMVDIYRREENFKRKMRLKDGKGFRAKSIESKNETGTLDQRPLVSEQTHQLTHVSDSYSLKWDAMKEKRDKMYDQEEKRDSRADMISTLNRLVINSEKTNIRMALAGTTTVVELASRKKKHKILRQQCESTQQNILEIKDNTLRSKAKNGSSLRGALQSSTMRANALLAQEVHLKSLLKEVTTVPHSVSSSTLVTDVTNIFNLIQIFLSLS